MNQSRIKNQHEHLQSELDQQIHKRVTRPAGVFLKSILSLMLVVPFSVSAANECRLKYKAGNSGYKYQSINKGQSTNLTKSDFKEAYNVGRNDIKLTLEYKDLTGRTRTEYMNLIKSGSATIPLPPIPLINKKLKKIKCQGYSTISDAVRLTQQLGNSASTLVSRATNAATASINTAATNASKLFTAQSANAYKRNSQTAIQSVTSALNAAKSSANATSSNIRTNLAQHFPEMNQAINASGQYGWQLKNTVMDQTKQNLTRTQSEVNRFDKKYNVSKTVSQLIRIDLAKDFPELNALKRVRCEISTGSIASFSGDLSRLKRELARLDKKYQFSKNVGKLSKTLATIPAADFRKLKSIAKRKDCSNSWQVLSKQIDTDGKLLSQYLSAVLKELKKLKASAFNRSQRQFYNEIKSLISRTESLIKEHKAQERRKTNLDEASANFDKSYKRIDNDLGPIQNDLEKFPGGSLVVDAGLLVKKQLPSWLTDDPKRLRQLLDAHARSTKSYDRAIKNHEEGKLKVKQKFDAWVRQSGKTIETATKLKVTLPKGNKLLVLLVKPPMLKVTEKAFIAAHKCLVESAANSLLVAQIAMEVIDQYLKNIGKVITDTIPEDVKKAMAQLNSAVVKLSATKLSELKSSSVEQARKDMDSRLKALWSQFSIDPTQKNFANQTNNIFKSIRAAVLELKQTGINLSKELSGSEKTWVQVALAADNLTKVLNRHGKSNWRDITKLQKSIPGLKLKWNQLAKIPKSIADCASKTASALEKAITRFPTRLSKLIRTKASQVANALPQPIKDKLNRLKASLSSAHATSSQLINAITAANSAYQQYVESQRNAVGSLVPLPKQNAPQKAQQALTKLNVLKQKLATAESRWTNFDAAQTALRNDVAGLISVTNKQRGELRADAQRIVFAPFNTNLFATQLSGVNNLTNLWNKAIQKLPSRLAALVTGGLSTQIESQINQGITWMNSKNTSLLRCINAAAGNRSSIIDSNQKNAAINQTVQGLNTEATAVITNLNSLIPPRIDLLSRLGSIFSSANNLSNRIANISTTAASNFSTKISRFSSQLNQAKSCVINNHNQINDKKNELLNLLPSNTRTTHSHRRG
ncbi:MAG: hypothetical protein KUG78_14735 [Kangiellaceae bacterium]|nr:hypothetical protein [Kangiellaceae bacterium]